MQRMQPAVNIDEINSRKGRKESQKALKKREKEEKRKKVDYHNLNSQNNQFVFVMPTLVLPPSIVQKVVDPSIYFGEDDTALLREIFRSSLDLSFSIGMLLSPSYDMNHLIEKYPSFAN